VYVDGYADAYVHDMVAADAGDTDYSNGKLYRYQTHLSGGHIAID